MFVLSVMYGNPSVHNFVCTVKTKELGDKIADYCEERNLTRNRPMIGRTGFDDRRHYINSFQDFLDHVQDDRNVQRMSGMWWRSFEVWDRLYGSGYEDTMRRQREREAEEKAIKDHDAPIIKKIEALVETLKDEGRKRSYLGR